VKAYRLEILSDSFPVPIIGFDPELSQEEEGSGGDESVFE